MTMFLKVEKLEPWSTSTICPGGCGIRWQSALQLFMRGGEGRLWKWCVCVCVPVCACPLCVGGISFSKSYSSQCLHMVTPGQLFPLWFSWLKLT